jgi:hypothetical protein
MNRRTFIATVALLLSPVVAEAKDKSFVFKIKTKSGSIISNIVIQAKDLDAAKVKLRQKYPDCEILEGHEKK